MKKSVLLLILLIIQLPLFAQDLLSKYKTGVVQLIPDETYARGNDWSTVFRSYYDSLNHHPIGMRKSIIVLDDGSVIVNHVLHDYHSLFSPDGKFVKEFKLEKGGEKAIAGVLNGNTLFTKLDKMGKMTCTDLDGNFKKMITLDYMTTGIVALPNKKLAVEGWVIWAEKFRTFVALVDYETNEQQVIWNRYTPREFGSGGKRIMTRPMFNYTVRLKPRGEVKFCTMPYSSVTSKGYPPEIALVNDHLIVSDPVEGMILTYDLSGKLVGKKPIDWTAAQLSVEEQKMIQQKAIEHYKIYVASDDRMVRGNRDGFKQMISEMEEDLKAIEQPLPKPSFATVIKDSDGNLLFFEIPEEKDGNVFHVWVQDKQGEFVAKCSFKCADYELNISPSKLVFHNGFIYALVVRKNVEGNPLRLVRFKLAA